MEKELTAQFERLNKKINTLLTEAKKPKQTWVKSTVIMSLTGWDKEKMRRCRNDNSIVFKKDNGFWYDLESVHPIFFKQNRQ